MSFTYVPGVIIHSFPPKWSPYVEQYFWLLMNQERCKLEAQPLRPEPHGGETPSMTAAYMRWVEVVGAPSIPVDLTRANSSIVSPETPFTWSNKCSYISRPQNGYSKSTTMGIICSIRLKTTNLLFCMVGQRRKMNFYDTWKHSCESSTTVSEWALL